MPKITKRERNALCLLLALDPSEVNEDTIVELRERVAAQIARPS